MPIYQYKCPHCGYENELFRKFDEIRAYFCPKCMDKENKATEMKRVYSQFTARFIGDGFQVNDYRKNNGSDS